MPGFNYEIKNWNASEPVLINDEMIYLNTEIYINKEGDGKIVLSAVTEKRATDFVQQLRALQEKLRNF